MRCKRKAFTLIELLVVVAIISVIMAILLPSLRSARESAKAVQCLANQRALGQALLMYEQEYRYLPNCDLSGGWWNWSFKLVRADLLPSAVGETKRGWIGTAGAPGSFQFVGIKAATPGTVSSPFHCAMVTPDDIAGTGYNFYINAYGTPQGVMGDIPCKRLSAFENQCDTVAAYDATNFAGGSTFGAVAPIWGCVWNNTTKDSIYKYFSVRHAGRANCLMLDGHAEPRKLSEMTTNNCPHP